LALLACAQAPKSWVKGPTTVTITATDTPSAMPAVQDLLAADAADRLTTKDQGDDTAHITRLLKGNIDEMAGYWPVVTLKDDPSKYTKADYAALILTPPGLVTYYESLFGPGTTPKVSGNAYEYLPMAVAMWQATKDPKYQTEIANCVKCLALFFDDELAKNPTKPVLYNRYWRSELFYAFLALHQLKGTPEYDGYMRTLGTSVGNLADAWPIAPFHGAYNMAFMAAFFYDFSLKYHPGPLKQEKELRAYADEIWGAWWDAHDCDEEDPHYTAGDLMNLHAWSLLRGQDWSTDPTRALLFRQYMEQVANDGTWPSYGDGGAPGDFVQGVWLGELLAGKFKDGRYKWLAHRAFWNGKPRIWKASVGKGYYVSMVLSLAYYFADDTVKEVPPKAGVTLTQRHWVDLTPPATRAAGGQWFTVNKDKIVPRTLMFRAGPKETDASLLLMAGQLGGHGHVNSGSVLYYGSDLGQYFDYATLRLDGTMESTNDFTLRDPDKPEPWPGHYGGSYTTEDCTVPVMGSLTQASYSRVHVQEYPDFPATPERWAACLAAKGWLPEKAIGYRNWPARLDRSLLFVNNQFTVVRDVLMPTLPVKAQLGPNWTFGELGAAGTNWVNTWMPKVIYEYGSLTRPTELQPRDLLIWFVPQKDNALVVEKETTPRKQIEAYYVPANGHINLPFRAWYQRTVDAQPGQPQAFTTVLLPHAPGMDAAKLAAAITTLRDDAGVTAVQVKGNDATRIVLLNSTGKPVTLGKLTTDAESALITITKTTHVSVWHATKATYGKTVVLNSKAPKDTEAELK
jgi:hypothetical protein